MWGSRSHAILIQNFSSLLQVAIYGRDENGEEYILGLPSGGDFEGRVELRYSQLIAENRQ